MNIQDRRENANKPENNTAQRAVTDFMEQLSTPPDKMVEFIFSKPLSGQLDFAFLKTSGYVNLTSIVLPEGEITEIRQLPEKIRKLVCSGNLLTSLDNLPPSLEELECENNNIETLNLSQTPALTIAKVSNNKLSSLGQSLPTTLLELYCENNNLSLLDLSELSSLRLLHASGNIALKLQNPPPSLIDLEMENDPFTNAVETVAGDKKRAASRQQEKHDYHESLQEYFRMKQKYEEKKRQMQHTAYEKGNSKKASRRRVAAVVPPCVNCGRKVGSIFSKKGEIYTALCGDKNEPCSLNINIDNSVSYQLDQYLTIFQEEIDGIKENIIKHKMDTLFHYVSDETSVQDFKKVLEEYHESTLLYNQVRAKYDALYNNLYKKESLQRRHQDLYETIHESKRHLLEYKNNGNRELLKKSVELQAGDITRTQKDIRELKYGIMEMKFDDDLGNVLFQRERKLGEYDYFVGIPPKVSRFVRG